MMKKTVFAAFAAISAAGVFAESSITIDGVNINGVNSIDDAAPTKRYAKVE